MNTEFPEGETSDAVKNSHTASHWVFVVVAICAVIIAMFVTYRATIERGSYIEDSLRLESTPISTESIKLDENPEINNVTEEDAVYTEETFEATIIMVADDSSYVRLAVEGKGVLSFEITSNTVTVGYDGKNEDITSFSPLTKLTVTAIQLPATAQYDMRAIHIARTLSPDEELTEKRMIMRSMHLN